MPSRADLNRCFARLILDFIVPILTPSICAICSYGRFSNSARTRALLCPGLSDFMALSNSINNSSRRRESAGSEKSGFSGGLLTERTLFFFIAFILLFFAIVKSHVEKLLRAGSKEGSFLYAARKTSWATSSHICRSFMRLAVILITGF